MVIYSCDECNKVFKRKANMNYHLDNNICCGKKYSCARCHASFTTQSNLCRHNRTGCKVNNDEINDDDKTKCRQIDTELDEIVKEIQEDFDHKFKKQKDDNEFKINKLREEYEMLKNQLAPSQKTNVMCNKNGNNVINNTVTNNVINVIVSFGKEDMSKIDEMDIVKSVKSGFHSALELTDAIHFNPKYPEYHNVYIPSMKDKYGMVYKEGNWELIDKQELIDKMYNDKKYYIEDNADTFYDSITKSQKSALKRWLLIDNDDDEKIKSIKDRMKLLLYNKRRIPIDTKKANRLAIK
jgi:hypothetical protein